MKKEYPNVILAAYGTPGIAALETLFALGLSPERIGLLTHESDSRNRPLWEFAQAKNIDLVKYSSHSEKAAMWINGRKADVLFSVHYRTRITGRILKALRYGAINLHPSLLPKYRGYFSTPWAIINGEKYTGFTYHYMDEKFDLGNIILQKPVRIRRYDTSFSIFHKLAIDGLRYFETVYKKVIEKNENGIPQPKGGSYYPRKVPFGGIIDPDWDEVKIERFIRAMYFPPYKGAVVRLPDGDHEVKSIEEYRRAFHPVRHSLDIRVSNGAREN